MAARHLRLAVLVGVLALLVPGAAVAYDDTDGLYAHSMINDLAFEGFVKDVLPSDPSMKNCSLDTGTLWSGVGIEGNKRGNWPKDISDGKSMTLSAKAWIAYGGFTSDEPEYPSALTHFYDPSNVREPWLTDQQIGVIFFRQASRLSPGTIVFGDDEIRNPHLSAKEIALHGTMKAGSSVYFQRLYSWDSAKAFYRAGLESTDKNSPNYGKAWRSLGEVMHLMADMCLPAHVRNDGHAAALMDADPLESTTGWQDVYNSAGNPCSSAIGYYVSSGGKQVANDPAVLFDQVAAWTHDNFYSKDTIDSAAVPNMRVVGSYAYRTIDGKDALAARVNKVYWDADSPPKTTYLIDKAVVGDQRKFLIPTAVKAGATLIDRFLPRFTVEVDPQPVDVGKPDGDYNVRVRLVHVPTPEWQEGLTVKNGAYLVVNDKKTEASLTGGDFNEYTVKTKLKPGDEVCAEYNLGGYVVRSSVVTVAAEPQGRTLKTWTEYAPDGRKTQEYTYYNNTQGQRIRHGVQRMYRSDGSIGEYTWADGIKNGPEKEYYRNGALSSEGQNTNGKQTGTWKTYYDTGALANTIQYDVNGEEEGVSYSYNANGKLQIEDVWSNGKLIKRTYYNADGSVSSVQTF